MHNYGNNVCYKPVIHMMAEVTAGYEVSYQNRGVIQLAI